MDLSDNKKSVSYLSNEETDQISRVVLMWLNQYPNKPVSNIKYEFLLDDRPCMALSTIQAAYKTRQYITGGYMAQYQFKIIYRLQPTTDNERLMADELLNMIGDWSTFPGNKPALGAGKRAVKLECNTRSSLFAAYDNGSEDHQILMTLSYEVI